MRNAIYNVIKSSCLTILSACLSISVAGCGNNDKTLPKAESAEKPMLAVTLPPLAALADSLSGGRVKIVTLMDDNSNPEAFELTMSRRADVEDADAVVSLGLFPFENVLAKQSGIKEKSHIIGKTVEPLYGSHTHGDGSTHNTVDPHKWSSPKNMMLMAPEITELLKSIDPDRAEIYDSLLAVNLKRINALDSTLTSTLKSPNKSARPFLMWHPSLGYLVRDYGLRWIAIQAENKEISAKQLSNSVARARDMGVELVILQKEYDSRQTSTLVKELQADTFTVNLLNPAWESELLMLSKKLSRQK